MAENKNNLLAEEDKPTSMPSIVPAERVNLPEVSDEVRSRVEEAQNNKELGPAHLYSAPKAASPINAPGVDEEMRSRVDKAQQENFTKETSTTNQIQDVADNKTYRTYKERTLGNLPGNEYVREWIRGGQPVDSSNIYGVLKESGLSDKDIQSAVWQHRGLTNLANAYNADYRVAKDEADRMASAQVREYADRTEGIPNEQMKFSMQFNSVPGAGWSLQEERTWRNRIANGNDSQALLDLEYITGLNFSDKDGKPYESIEAAEVGMYERRNALNEELAAQQAILDNKKSTDAQKKAAQARIIEIEEEDNELKTAYLALNEALDKIGAVDANGAFVRPNKLTGEDIWESRVSAPDKDRVQLANQQRAVQKARTLTGLADLAAGVGDMIKATNGARVDARDWNSKYKTLDTRAQKLYDVYQAKMEKLRQEKVAREAQAQKDAVDMMKLNMRLQAAANEKEKDRKQKAELQDKALKAAADRNAAQINAANKRAANKLSYLKNAQEKSSKLSIGFDGSTYVFPESTASVANDAIYGVLKDVASNRIQGADANTVSDIHSAISDIKLAYGDDATSANAVSVIVNSILERYGDSLPLTAKSKIRKIIRQNSGKVHGGKSNNSVELHGEDSSESTGSLINLLDQSLYGDDNDVNTDSLSVDGFWEDLKSGNNPNNEE